MAFTVDALGIAERKRYHFGPKVYADPGQVIKGFELLQKLADKAKVSLGGLDDNYKLGVQAMADLTITRLLRDLLVWLGDNDARITISYSRSGVWGGVLRQPVHRSDFILFHSSGGPDIARTRFVNLLEQMKINKWGYIRGLLAPMAGYETHCEQYGTKRGAVALWLKIAE